LEYARQQFEQQKTVSSHPFKRIDFFCLILLFKTTYAEISALKFNDADEIIKNKDKVVFQIENQNLSPLADNSFYDLVAIVFHLGTDLLSGHYVNYVLENDKWVYYSDEMGKIFDIHNLLDNLSENIYLLIYEIQLKRPHKKSRIETPERATTRVSISSYVPEPEEIDVNISQLAYKLPEEIENLNESLRNISFKSDDEDKEDNEPEVESDVDEMDVDGVDENSVNYITFAKQKMFFTFKEDNEPSSGLISINNLLEKLIINSNELEAAQAIWSEYNDIVCVLNKNGIVLKVVDYDNYVKLNYTADPVSYLVFNDKHYFVLKRFQAGGSLFKLDPMRTIPEIMTEEKLKYLNVLKQKHNKDKNRFKLSEIVYSNSSIMINNIEQSINLHDICDGKL
jgi:hypothetical protein